MLCTYRGKVQLMSETATMFSPISKCLLKRGKREKAFKLHGGNILSHHGTLDLVVSYRFPHNWWNHFYAPCIFIVNWIIHSYGIILTLKSSPILQLNFWEKYMNNYVESSVCLAGCLQFFFFSSFFSFLCQRKDLFPSSLQRTGLPCAAETVLAGLDT